MAIAHAEPGQVVDILGAKGTAGEGTVALFKTPQLEVIRMQVDDEPVRHERAIGRGQSFGFHRPLDAVLDLDRLEPCPEEPRGRALE